MSALINTSYLLACFLMIVSIRSLAAPHTARRGNILGMAGMALAVAAAAMALRLPNYPLVVLIIILGAAVGTYSALKVKITALPQMIAAFNGLGGLAAVCIALSEVISSSPKNLDNTIGMIIGGLAFSGSFVAFAKLQGLITAKSITFPLQYPLNAALFISVIALSVWFIAEPEQTLFFALTALVLILGFLLILPIGGADMPVVISLLNGGSGWAAVGIGLSLDNSLLIIIGSVVGAGGSILAYIMIKAMNRSLLNILTGGFSAHTADTPADETRTARAGAPEDAAFIMENAAKIIIVPGFGMAAAQAQHAVKTMAALLRDKYRVEVKFAIHPVAGRMPGHMNVLLAEAGIDYADIYEMADINNEFASADVAYVIGANDITNPSAKDDTSSPLYGMPVLDVAKAKTVFFVKRSLGGGYSGVDNPLFYAPNTIMLYGDARDITEKIVKVLEN